MTCANPRRRSSGPGSASANPSTSPSHQRARPLFNQIKNITKSFGDLGVDQRIEPLARALGQLVLRPRDEQAVRLLRAATDALLDVQAIRDRIVVTPEDVQRYYEDNAQQFSSPEQVRASHILIRLDEKADAAAKKKARAEIDAVLKQVKAGGDFAKLAQQLN